ncbi:MAG: hypothetical protein ACYCSJ_01465 [Acidimicrobiales bacterium]
MAWATTVLRKLNAPISSVQVAVLDLWAQSEGMPDSANNWLACGTPWPGSTTFNSTGVQIYPTYNAGTSAIAWSLNHPPYTDIGNAFRAAPGMVRLWQLINASPWCGGCQTGHYPIALWTVAGKPSQRTPVGTPTATPGAHPTPTTTGGPTGIPVLAWGRIQEDAGSHALTLKGRMIALATRIRKA